MPSSRSPTTCSGSSTPPTTCRCGTACRRPTATARRSAVLILFGEGPRGPDVLLIEKSAHLRSHAGQPAFPGGGVDPGDDFPVGTALREAEEEAGIDPAGVRVLATLQELFLPPSDRLVVPVVGVVGRPAGRDRRRPAARWRGSPGCRWPTSPTRPTATGCAIPSGFVGPAFCVADMEVWGFTAGLLDAILEAAGPGPAVGHGDVRPLPESAIRPYTLPGPVTTRTATTPRRRSPTPRPTALRRVRFRSDEDDARVRRRGRGGPCSRGGAAA